MLSQATIWTEWLEMPFQGNVVWVQVFQLQGLSLPQRFCDMKQRCEQTTLVPRVPAVWVVHMRHPRKPTDGDRVSFQAVLWSLPVRRSSSALLSLASSTRGSAWEQQGQRHVLRANSETQVMICIVSEREEAKASRDLGKTWLFLEEFSRVDVLQES